MREPMHLRDYQLESVDALREGIRAGHRAQLLVAPTGAGKTVMAAHLLGEAERRRSQSAFIVDRVSLVDQTSATLDRYGIEHGVIQAGHWRYRATAPIQVCSAQTIERRGFGTGWKLVLIDEAHCIRQNLANWMKRHNNITVIGLTATPFAPGLAELYTNTVNVTTTNRLIADGHLVPLKVFAAKAIDMEGAKVVAGEWAEKEIETRGRAIIGDVVAEWISKSQQFFGGPAKTIVFSATVEHGDELCRQFQAAGFDFRQVSYKDGNDDSRRALIEEFRRPNSSIVGLVSCEALTKGFDVPDVRIGVACRPYRKSFSSHIQQLGRVMRTSPGKDFGLWLDHCGNFLRFYDDQQALFERGVDGLDDSELDKKPRQEPGEAEKNEMKCSACGFVLPKGAPACPACGAERRRKQSLVEAIPGQMIEIGGTTAKKQPAYLADREAVWAQLAGMALDRKNGDLDAASKWARVQYKSLYNEWPKHPLDVATAVPPSDQIRRKVMQGIIAWAKARDASKQGAPA